MTYIVGEWDLNPICRYKFLVSFLVLYGSDEVRIEKLKLITQKCVNRVVHDCVLCIYIYIYIYIYVYTHVYMYVLTEAQRRYFI